MTPEVRKSKKKSNVKLTSIMNPSIVIYVIGMLTISMTTMLVMPSDKLKASPTLNADWTLKSILLVKEIPSFDLLHKPNGLFGIHQVIF